MARSPLRITRSMAAQGQANDSTRARVPRHSYVNCYYETIALVGFFFFLVLQSGVHLSSDKSADDAFDSVRFISRLLLTLVRMYNVIVAHSNKVI